MQELRFSFSQIRHLLIAFFLVGGPFLQSEVDHPSYIEKKVWKRVSPYLLPEDHPIHPILDELFTGSRVTLGIESMEKAGFLHVFPRKYTHVIVTKHPKLPGFIFKLYLDAQRQFKGKSEYEHWIERIEGVELIAKEIEKREWQDLFKTPKKWIYLLPEYPAPPKEFKRKNFILVEHDMDILDQKANYKKWKSDVVTKDILLTFYTVLEELGLHDCAKPDNAPFSKDGKIAFIDTQSHSRWPVLYKKLTPYLSKEMRKYWKSLTK